MTGVLSPFTIPSSPQALADFVKRAYGVNGTYEMQVQARRALTQDPMAFVEVLQAGFQLPFGFASNMVRAGLVVADGTGALSVVSDVESRAAAYAAKHANDDWNSIYRVGLRSMGYEVEPLQTSSGARIDPLALNEIQPTAQQAQQQATVTNAPSQDSLRTADQWAYAFHALNPGVTLPAPEAYGFVGTGRGELVTFDEWWYRLTRAFPQYASGNIGGLDPTPNTSGPEPMTTTTTASGGGGGLEGPAAELPGLGGFGLADFARNNPIIAAAVVGFGLWLMFGGGPRS